MSNSTLDTMIFLVDWSPVFFILIAIWLILANPRSSQPLRATAKGLIWCLSSYLLLYFLNYWWGNTYLIDYKITLNNFMNFAYLVNILLICCIALAIIVDLKNNVYSFIWGIASCLFYFDISFFPGVMIHDLLVNAKDYTKIYQERYDKLILEKQDMKADQQTIGVYLPLLESKYQNALFGYYWKKRCQSKSLDEVLEMINKNKKMIDPSDEANISGVIRAANEYVFFKNLNSSNNTLLVEYNNAISEYNEELDFDQKRRNLKRPFIHINPKLEQDYEKLRASHTEYINNRTKAKLDEINRESFEIQYTKVNGIDCYQVCLEQIVKDISNCYSLYKISSFKAGDIKLIPSINEDDINSADKNDARQLSIIKQEFEKRSTVINSLIKQKEFSQVIREILDLLDGDSDNTQGIIPTIKRLSPETKKRAELLEFCQQMRKKITVVCAEPFIQEFDKAIEPFSNNDYTKIYDSAFWRDVLDSLQGIKESMDLTAYSEYVSEYQTRFDKIYEILKEAKEGKKSNEVFYVRFENQVTALMKDSWAARGFYNVAYNLRTQYYDEPIELRKKETLQDALINVKKAQALIKNNKNSGEFSDDCKKLEEKIIHDIKSFDLYIESLNDIKNALNTSKSKDRLSLLNNALNKLNTVLEFVPDDITYKRLKVEIINLITAEKYFIAAQEADVSEKYQEALNLVNNSLKLFPEDFRFKKLQEQLQNKIEAEMLYESAVALKEKEQYALAFENIEKAIALFPNNQKYLFFRNEIQTLANNQRAEKLYNEAVELKNKGLYAAALNKIAEAIQLVPDNEKYISFKLNVQTLADDQNAEKLYNEALELKENKQYSQALPKIEEGEQLASSKAKFNRLKDVVMRLDLIQSHIKNAKYREADSEIKSCYAQYPKDAQLEEYKKDLDVIYIKKKNGVVEEYYKQAKAYQNNKQSSEALRDTCKAIKLINATKEKSAFQSELLSLRDDLIKNCLDRAVEYRKEKLYPEALNEVHNVLLFFPDNKECQQLNKAILQEFRNQINEIIKNQTAEQYSVTLKNIDKALQLYPDNSDLRRFQDEIIKKFFEPGQKAGDQRVFVINGVEFLLCWCPSTIENLKTNEGQEFAMGKNPLDSNNAAEDKFCGYVVIQNGFWLMANEVTNEQWNAIQQRLNATQKRNVQLNQQNSAVPDDRWSLLDYASDDIANNANPNTQDVAIGVNASSDDRSETTLNRNNNDNLPKTNISWNDCNELCKSMSKLGIDMYIPTEAQWEFACKSGKKSGKLNRQYTDFAWMNDNSGNHVHPVKGKDPNDWGLFDLRGNVSEWTNDYYGPYNEAAQTDPAGPQGGTARVYRGGYYNSKTCYSTTRESLSPTEKREYIGVRFVFGKTPELNYNGYGGNRALPWANASGGPDGHKWSNGGAIAQNFGGWIALGGQLAQQRGETLRQANAQNLETIKKTEVENIGFEE